MIVTLLIIGILIGAILGLTGAGGSVIAVPLLFLFLKLEPAAATGLALGVVAITSLYGSLYHIVRKQVLWIPAVLFGISGALLSPFGRITANHIDSHLLLIGFAVLSLIIAARMLQQSISNPEDAQVVRASTENTSSDPLLCQLSETKLFDWRLRCVSGLVSGGSATGLLSGLFGVGGGFLIVPFLNQLNGVSMRNAVATSLVIISAISTSGFVTHLLIQPVNWQQLAYLGLGGIGGMAIGNVFAQRLAGVLLQRIFALTIILMAVILFNQ